MHTKDAQPADVFAQIAQQRVDSSSRELIEPQPPARPKRALPLAAQAAGAHFRPLRKLETAEDLARELAIHRKRHARFLRNLAPDLTQYRIGLPLKRFDWRIETEADRQDFPGTLAGGGQWESVTIPHYGGPLGRAVTYYRTTFKLTRAMLKIGAVFVRFKGVDYKAHVFVNGSFLGSHEGFFAPFEFELTGHARLGANTLLVKVENDAICMGNNSWGDDGSQFEGDKIYAATGPGYDDSSIGWHHCPPGMGIYQDVLIEARAPLHIHDLFVRPLLDEKKAEALVSVWNCGKLRREFRLRLSVVGQNFKATVFSDLEFPVPGPAGPGVNQYRFLFDMPDAKLWDLETPWLYRIQATLTDCDGNPIDSASRQFGMRSFRMDVDSEPRGRMYLNGREIRLRGANTMGFEQQDVMKRDWPQLVDDLLLAKICHMNFLRLTQRPVQDEVYDYCDRLGVLTQTDLPLFGIMRRNQFSEGVRQAGEMERLVRSHPCNIMVTYINEPYHDPFPWKPWRSLSRPELESFFRACDEIVRLENPDRVIKAVDGDYNPPAPGLPDNHCYNGWYTGHGLDLGKLHRGYWQKVKPGWMYACGEFGCEGLDPANVMRKHYPSAWLPCSPEEEKAWRPDSIVKAQTGPFHYMWFDTQCSLEAWVAASQQHQAWVTRLMTEAFRRDSRMNSCAIHLFIDAFPSGWMKAIMDVERQPKPAYFAYREALTPLMVNLRMDRFAVFSGQKIECEAWICNDTSDVMTGAQLAYRIEQDGKLLAGGITPAVIQKSASTCQGRIAFSAPKVTQRAPHTIRLALQDNAGRVIPSCSRPSCPILRTRRLAMNSVPSEVRILTGSVPALR